MLLENGHEATSAAADITTDEAIAISFIGVFRIFPIELVFQPCAWLSLNIDPDQICQETLLKLGIAHGKNHERLFCSGLYATYIPRFGQETLK